ncbi:hypothetical protein CPT_Michonne136 [Citrobacter phage Michonne]|uniref:Uncharacterized protein n=1 Tax=Citrobacter phage Michonne TaxID=1675603 RepID=A0A0K1LPK7_9CAUD|nr:hypothetical protein CPT_Michonne_gp093 [Citrobacter phage Michonne]AKU44085.1 hypothetical protein CPT_Michonne136 [Citrobacter phage Michonne]AYR00874.1 hypothetical protein CPT_Maleficent_155 [Citrobacter phage Maleficent]
MKVQPYYTEFKDSNGEICTLQRSSSYEPRIWLGAKEVSVKYLNNGWKELNIPALTGKDFVGNQRMHLNQAQVKELLPYLQYFTENGELPNCEISPETSTDDKQELLKLIEEYGDSRYNEAGESCVGSIEALTLWEESSAALLQQIKEIIK